MTVNLYRRRLEASCSFYLLNDSFVFFSYWTVQTSALQKFGPIWYQGPFNFARRPARFIPFSDTKAVAKAFDAALTVPPEPLSVAEYQALVAQGNPVLLELKLKNQAALGRMAYCFHFDDYGGVEFKPTVGLVPERRRAVRGWGRAKARNPAKR